MKKMKYSEENYKNNRNNKKFMAGRSDGFGVRMIALLNAMYCSKKFNLPFASAPALTSPYVELCSRLLRQIN